MSGYVSPHAAATSQAVVPGTETKRAQLAMASCRPMILRGSGSLAGVWASDRRVPSKPQGQRHHMPGGGCTMKSMARIGYYARGNGEICRAGKRGRDTTGVLGVQHVVLPDCRPGTSNGPTGF